MYPYTISKLNLVNDGFPNEVQFLIVRVKETRFSTGQ